MLPIDHHRNRPRRVIPQSAAPRGHDVPALDDGRAGGLRSWMRAAVRTWRQRKLIAALQAMDDGTLAAMAIDRADIGRIVRGFDDRELRMVPLDPRAIDTPETSRQAA